MEIPKDKLEHVISSLCNLVDERTSAPWASYSEDDLSMDEQDYEDAQRVRTVFDVFQWLVCQGNREYLIEWAHCLDPLEKFDEENIPEDKNPEEVFRKYLAETYDIDPEEFPYLF